MFARAVHLVFLVFQIKGAELGHVPGVLRDDFWCCVEIDEGAVSVRPALKGREGAAHYRQYEDEQRGN